MRRKGVFRSITAAVAVSAAATAAMPSAGAQFGPEAPLAWWGDGDFHETTPYLDETVSYGTAGDVPVASVHPFGRFLGVWRPSDTKFRLDGNGDGLTDATIRYGTAGDLPIASFRVDFSFPSGFEEDLSPFGPLKPSIGVFRPSDGRWRIDDNLDGRTDHLIAYGTSGDIPVYGHVNSDLEPDIAVFRPSNGTFYVDTNRDGRTDWRLAFGTAGDVPFFVSPFPTMFGGVTSGGVGVYRPSDGKVRVDINRNGVTDATRVVSPFESEVVAGAQFLGLAGFGNYLVLRSNG